jgi:hypothetical protein
MSSVLFILFFITSYSTLSIASSNLLEAMPDYSRMVRSDEWLKNKGYIYQGFHWIGEVIFDAIRLNANLFSVDSAKIITAVIPFYLITRMVDEPVQNNFYDPCCHKNVNQLPKACSALARHGVAVPMIVLSSMALFAKDPDLRLTGRMVAIGLPFVQSGKDIIKNLDFKCCLRPWHEDFSRKKRSCGGFPSGHLATMTYMTALFGMRHGPAWGIPLGVFGTFVAVNFLACNRHYLSQLVAGVGLGLLFAVAASKVVDTKLAEQWSFEPAIDQDSVGLRVAYCF